MSVIARLFVRRYLHQPFNFLIKGIENLSEGRSAPSFPPFKQREMQTIVSKFQEMTNPIKNRQDSLENANRLLENEIPP